MQSHDVDVAVVNPTVQGVVAQEGGTYLGGLFGLPSGWSRVGAAAPDGTYALARYDADTVELLTDVCATRAVWWTLTKDSLLASTSQRALVALLGDLELDPVAAAWLLSSGTLGPETAWDRRLKPLPPDSRLVLDRVAWRCDVRRTPAEFTAAPGGRQQQVARLREAIVATCGELDLDLSRWLLPLSGGLDSRVILAGISAHGSRPACITWTTKASMRHPFSDATIARRVARRFDADHHYEILAEPGQGVAWALDHFVAGGEGRTDEFAGYVDGCAMWGDLAQRGVCGVIRGDESAGERKRDAHDAGSRRGAGGIMAGDFAPGHVIRRLGLAPQQWPSWLERQQGESREAYCDRMSQQVYVPLVLGPLNAIKGRYVEMVNPLLSRRIIAVVRSLPDELRVYGRALHDVAASACPGIPYARFSSLPDAGEYASRPEFVETLVRELMAPAMSRVLSEEGVATLLAAMAAKPAPESLRRRIFSTLKSGSVLLPARTFDRLAPRYDQPDPLGPTRIALRAAIASKSIALLEADAALLREPAAVTV